MKKILLIEDHQEIRENTTEILQLAGYQVNAAENGKVGVELARQNSPDLVVCDIMMPVLDGYGVLHCTSLYPPQRNELRLNNILFLKKKYNIPVGFSDHSENEKAAIVAKSYGATFFEKHVTLDKKMIGPDHAFALNLKMLKNYVNKIKKQKFRKKKITEKFLHLSNREKVVRKKYLKGLIASRDIKKNTIIKTTHIKICRPLGNGMEPKYFTKIIGKKTRSFIMADNNFMKSDISR
jgi:N-acetylneuraminate synthase/N,N'-diacetyllegionaminate synthase